VSAGDDADADRKKRLTFEQAEGAAPLPSQLKLKEISKELRAALWSVIYTHLADATKYSPMGGGSYLSSPWDRIFRHMHVARDHAMADEFQNDAQLLISKVKSIFQEGDHVAIFGWLQYVLRLGKLRPYTLAKDVERALRLGRAAYRVIDENTIVPIGSDEELTTLKRAFADLAATEFHGARAHLRKAAEGLTAAKYSDSIRESIHAVESVARTLAQVANCPTRSRSLNSPQRFTAV
jgi:hypothetical protein